MPALASAQTPSPPPAPFERQRVLDIENRRIVAADDKPSGSLRICDVLIVGGGVGGVAAAEAALRAGRTVILTEPTRLLGGQLTSQLVPVPDENSYIEREPGASTRTFRALRESVRRHYAGLPDILLGREKNVGACWVSRVSGMPDIWEAAIRERLEPYVRAGRLKAVLTRHQLRSVARFSGNGRFNYADIVDLDTGRVAQVAAKYLLDATEDGAALALAGLPTGLGQEGLDAYDEPHAPDEAHPEWIQSFTYCFLLRWDAAPGTPIAPPEDYERFKGMGEYTLDYIYRGRTPEPYTVRYQVLKTVEKAGGPFWTYRRLLAASSFRGGQSPVGDVALINWRGNDFHEVSYLDKPLDEQVEALERGRAFARGFLYWLQTECPRDEGGAGYPEMQPFAQAGVDADGMALHPYIRESRRLQARFMLNENHLLTPADDPKARWGTEFFDSVGCALYAIDIHPSQTEQPLLVPALPCHIPLGAFLTTSGPVNVLPAAKNFGGSRLALASARMHPTEWLAGEVAGNLAAFCIERDLPDPSLVRDVPALLNAFQTQLKAGGVTISWRDILPPPTP
jgi:hypothetical protein